MSADISKLLEGRIADLERTVAFQADALKMLVGSYKQSAASNQKIFDVLVGSLMQVEEQRDAWCRELARFVPDETTRNDISKIISRGSLNRDQLNADIESLKAQPQPSEILSKLGLVLQQLPGVQIPPTPSPGA